MPLASALPTRLPTTSGAGGTYYVDPVAGDDTRSSAQAQTRSTAWRTINKALATVPTAGAIVKVLPGTFQAGAAGTATPINVTGRLFSTSDPLTVMAETPLTVTLQPTQVQNSYGVLLRSTAGIRIQGFVFDPITVAGSQVFQSNVVIYDSSRVEITGCEFHPAGEKGIMISGGPTDSGRTTNDVWVIGNTFRPKGTDPFAYVSGVDFPLGTYYGSRGAHFIYCGAWGTNGSTWDQVNGARRTVITNNVFVGSTHGRDIELGPEGRDGFVVNNTFYGNHNIQKIAADNGTPSNLNVDINGFQAAAGQSAVGVIQFCNASAAQWKSGNNVVANNIFCDLDGNAVTAGTPGGGGGFDQSLITRNLAYQTRNCYGYSGSATVTYQPASQGVGTPQFTVTGNLPDADPKFTDPVRYDYTLQATSPAIAAADPQYTPTIDITGAARSATAPSLGAYEGAGGSPPPPPPPPGGGATYIGTTTPGGSQTAGLTGDWKGASLATVANDLTVNRVRWYLAGGAANQTARAALYTNTSFGEPGVLVVQSPDVIVAAGKPAGWVDFTVAVTTLAAGSYWIALNYGPTSGQMVAFYDPGGQERYNPNPFASGFSDPFGSATGPSATLSAYADYLLYDASVLRDATVHGSTVRLLFSEALAAPAVPLGAFQVFVGGPSANVTAVAGNDAEIVLTVSPAATSSDTVSVVYTPPDVSPLADLSGATVAAFAATVRNTTGRTVGTARTTAIARTVNPSQRVQGRGGGGI
jgi:hypothetical protein